MSFTAEDVIEHLEQCGREPYRFFIDLSHGYFFNATTSLHLYADDGRWAMIFETAGYANRGRSIELELFRYGNCLRELPRAGANGMFECNMESVELVEPHEFERIEDDFESVALSVGGLTIRGVQLVVPTVAEAFREAGIEVGRRACVGMGPCPLPRGPLSWPFQSDGHRASKAPSPGSSSSANGPRVASSAVRGL